jgi:beta-phosphoglucomutase
MGVASNSVRRTVEVTLEKTRLAPYLDFMLSSEDVKYSKPHPEIYCKAIALMGFSSNECLIVEDNINGIKAAEAAGGCLMTVETVDDVNLKNILGSIDKCTAPIEMVNQA